jgi:hypothetical protein
LPKGRLHSPKTARTECRFFCHGESIRRKCFPRKKTIIPERRLRVSPSFPRRNCEPESIRGHYGSGSVLGDNWSILRQSDI